MQLPNNMHATGLHQAASLALKPAGAQGGTAESTSLARAKPHTASHRAADLAPGRHTRDDGRTIKPSTASTIPQARNNCAEATAIYARALPTPLEEPVLASLLGKGIEALFLPVSCPALRRTQPLNEAAFEFSKTRLQGLG
jgi:hypothetical protein